MINYELCIDWQPAINDRSPLWSLSEFGLLKIDVTKWFDAKYRLTAYTILYDELYDEIRKKLMKIIINPYSKHLYGYTDEVFNCIPPIGHGWFVSNNICYAPSVKGPPSLLTENPHNGFQIQFHSVPYNVFKRYWRRPVSLTSKWRTQLKTGKYPSNLLWSHHCKNVLLFEEHHLKKYKLIYVDFSHGGYLTSDETTIDMVNWMVKYAPVLKFFTDEETPFVKEHHEFLFTTEWL